MMNFRNVCALLVAMGLLMTGGGCRSGCAASASAGSASADSGSAGSVSAESGTARSVAGDSGGAGEIGARTEVARDGGFREVETPKWYEPEIRAFERADRASPPEPGMVLCIGSSSIRMWSTLGEDMAPARVLNRGFGGSKTGEVLEVFERIVVPYEPRAIVYYCGDNDLGTENTDAESAAAGFIEFDRRARAIWPQVEVMYIAIKPSISRWSNWEAMRRANEIVRAYCERTEGATFLDIATPMLGADGKPDPTLFAEDGLHLNARGYEVWTRVVRGEVVRAWEKPRSP